MGRLITLPLDNRLTSIFRNVDCNAVGDCKNKSKDNDNKIR